jgi:hypothetical protein
MLFALLYSLVRLILDTLIDRYQPEVELQLELLVVRHQLRVLQRQAKRPRWRPADRFLLVGLITATLPVKRRRLVSGIRYISP